MITREDYLKKFNRMVNEYTTPSNLSVQEEGEVDPAMAQQDPNAAAMPADPAAAAAPMDPAAAAAPADPNAAAAPVDPNAAAAPSDPNAAAAPVDPNAAAAPVEPAPAEPAPEEAEGFTPDEENEEDSEEAKKDEEEMDDVKKAAKHAETKIDSLSDKFERLMGKLDSVEKQIEANNQDIAKFKMEMEKRNPTPEQKMTLRSQQSGPFTETPDEYWNDKEQTSNYSPDDDHNGEDMPVYQIKQSDVDGIRDWTNISKSFDDERMGLKDILGI